MRGFTPHVLTMARAKPCWSQSQEQHLSLPQVAGSQVLGSPAVFLGAVSGSWISSTVAETVTGTPRLDASIAKGNQATLAQWWLCNSFYLVLEFISYYFLHLFMRDIDLQFFVSYLFLVWYRAVLVSRCKLGTISIAFASCKTFWRTDRISSLNGRIHQRTYLNLVLSV